MELLIVRHAIAFERSARRWPDDRDRPLSPRGLERARQAAQGLARLVKPPGRVLASPLARTLQTAELLTRFARWPQAARCPQLEPGAAPDALFALLPATGRVALIGHEPDLSRLLSACLPGDFGGAAFRFRKMGVALVTFAGVAQRGRGKLAWFAAPRLLRAARKVR